MSSALAVREDAIYPFTPAADQSAKRGYLVTVSEDTATLSASASTMADGIILEGADTDGESIVGMLSGLRSPVMGKLGGSVTKGDLLAQHTDGTMITDAGSGARVLVAQAMETGVAGDLIEIVCFKPITLS